MVMNEYPHKITFQQSTTVKDGYGGGEKTWADVYTTEANVQPLNSFEYTQAQQLTSPIDHKTFIPYTDTPLNASMRFIHNGKIHLVRSQPLDQGGMGEVMIIQSRVE